MSNVFAIPDDLIVMIKSSGLAMLQPSSRWPSRQAASSRRSIVPDVYLLGFAEANRCQQLLAHYEYCR